MMTDDARTDEEEARLDRVPFTAFVADFRQGSLASSLTDALAGLVRSVDEYDKAGELILRVKVVPEGDVKRVTCDVAVKEPKAPAPVALYFSDDDGQLMRDDPNRPRLPLE